MSRTLMIALSLALLPASASFAQTTAVGAKGKLSSGVIPVGLYGEAKPSASCSNCKVTQASGSVTGKLYLDQPVPQGDYGGYLRHQLMWDRHECSPDGCPKAVGCSNFWSECKFIFGSCRQFYGTAEATIYHHRNTRYRDYP